MQTILLLWFLTILSEQRITAVKESCPFENVSISALINPPYVDTTSGIINELILDGLRTCFKTKICEEKIKHLQWKWLQSEDEMVTAIKKKQSELVFPVPPSLITKRKRQEVEYYPVVTSPGLALIVNYHACKKIANTVLSQTVSSVWPILVFTLLLAGISGVCMWAMEHQSNNQQFSTPFARGSYDGFWWAVVSMTTVGYGNQVPRSLLGRLFSLLWILAGVTMISVFTASISSAITVVSVQQHCSGLQGKLIAVLNNSEAEEHARHHGAIVRGYNDVDPMFANLKLLKIKGILMDRFKAYYYLSTRKDEGFRIAEVVTNKVQYSVAMVTDNSTVTLDECFVDVLENPRSKINKIMKKYIHPVKPLSTSNDTIGLFSSNSDTVHNVLIALAIVLAVLIVCGLSWEIVYQHYNCFRPKSIPNNVLTNVEDIAMETTHHHDNQIVQLQATITDLTKQIQVLKCQLQRTGTNPVAERTDS